MKPRKGDDDVAAAGDAGKSKAYRAAELECLHAVRFFAQLMIVGCVVVVWLLLLLLVVEV